MNLLAALRAHRLLAIVRGSDPDAALTTVLTLAEEGVTLIEVSLSGRDALDVIARARAALGPDATLGAGTVLSCDDARAFLDVVRAEPRP
jgi:2-dehydro-3-deoxyphosphogluconate aldolase/(4S)-4-hydroxy-2-oxoglutarate aldolase